MGEPGWASNRVSDGQSFITAVYVPGSDRTVVTASGDSPETFGACDVALGTSDRRRPCSKEEERFIRRDWTNQRIHHEQQPWEYPFAPGLVSEDEGNAWAEEVWGERGETPRNSEDFSLSRFRHNWRPAIGASFSYLGLNTFLASRGIEEYI